MTKQCADAMTLIAATRRAFLASLCAVCAPASLTSCSSKPDVVGRVNAGAEPEAGSPTSGAVNESGASEPFDAAEPPQWSGDDDAGRGPQLDVQVIVRARPAPPDAAGPERWPLSRPLAPFEAMDTDSDFGETGGAEPQFGADGGFGTGGLQGSDGLDGAGDHDDPMWDDPEPRPGSSSQEQGPELPPELFLRFFGRDAQRLIEWSPVRLSFMRESEPLLIEDSAGALYFVMLRLET